MKPEYGKVIVGFPGVGKSALAYNNDYVIDLDSSLFNVNDKKPEGWEIQYCNVARWLCRCGFTVCVSAHKEVRKELLRKPADEQILVYPSLDLKNEWCLNLSMNYHFSIPDVKRLRYEYIKRNYDDSIKELMSETGFKHIVIEDMGYYLAEMLGIR